MQTNAIDPEQVSDAAEEERTREARIFNLWGYILARPDGREFVSTVLLGDLGYDTLIRIPRVDAAPAPVFAEVALRNMAVFWLTERIRPHRESYRAMVKEAQDREDKQRAIEAGKRARYAHTESTND